MLLFSYIFSSGRAPTSISIILNWSSIIFQHSNSNSNILCSRICFIFQLLYALEFLITPISQLINYCDSTHSICSIFPKTFFNQLNYPPWHTTVNIERYECEQDGTYRQFSYTRTTLSKLYRLALL